MASEEDIKTEGITAANPPKRLVLIDDEAGVVLALKLVLSTLGLQVEAFSDPEKGLDFIRSSAAAGSASCGLEDSNTGQIPAQTISIDFILCDLRMPKKSGFDVLKECKQIAANIPFYLMSGHADDAEQRQAITFGASGFLAKPFSPDDFLQLIKSR